VSWPATGRRRLPSPARYARTSFRSEFRTPETRDLCRRRTKSLREPRFYSTPSSVPGPATAKGLRPTECSGGIRPFGHLRADRSPARSQICANYSICGVKENELTTEDGSGGAAFCRPNGKIADRRVPASSGSEMIGQSVVRTRARRRCRGRRSGWRQPERTEYCLSSIARSLEKSFQRAAGLGAG
jgi:hypothetical protein